MAVRLLYLVIVRNSGAWRENRRAPSGVIRYCSQKTAPVPVLGSVTFGPPLRLEADEERDAFLARARAALLSLRRS